MKENHSRQFISAAVFNRRYRERRLISSVLSRTGERDAAVRPGSSAPEGTPRHRGRCGRRIARGGILQLAIFTRGHVIIAHPLDIAEAVSRVPVNLISWVSPGLMLLPPLRKTVEVGAIRRT